MEGWRERGCDNWQIMASDAGAKQIEINNFESVGNRSTPPSSPSPSSFPSNPFENSLEIHPPPPSLPLFLTRKTSRSNRSKRGEGGREGRVLIPRVQRALISDVIVNPRYFKINGPTSRCPASCVPPLRISVHFNSFFQTRHVCMVYYIHAIFRSRGSRGLRYLVAASPVVDDTDIDRID